MIAIVQGTLLEKGLEHILVDTGGIGYRIRVPLRTLAELGDPGDKVCLRTHLDVREDSWTLYGFSCQEEVDLFHLLTSVNGVGPKIALAILSVHDVPEIAQGILEEDSRMFTRVSGVGKKTAARLLLELKEKVQPYVLALTSLPAGRGASGSKVGRVGKPAVDEEVRQALLALGFQIAEIDEALKAAREKLEGTPSTEVLLRQALSAFRRR
jgi:Holliday junction DNA helicase RuvA